LFFQVATRAGEWVDAVPIDSTVLVNIADLLQRWTADQLVSTVNIQFNMGLRDVGRNFLGGVYHFREGLG